MPRLPQPSAPRLLQPALPRRRQLTAAAAQSEAKAAARSTAPAEPTAERRPQPEATRRQQLAAVRKAEPVELCLPQTEAGPSCLQLMAPRAGRSPHRLSPHRHTDRCRQRSAAACARSHIYSTTPRRPQPPRPPCAVPAAASGAESSAVLCASPVPLPQLAVHCSEVPLWLRLYRFQPAAPHRFQPAGQHRFQPAAQHWFQPAAHVYDHTSND